jgi:hypothetical protein
METITGEQVVQVARRYLGAPFKLHGRDERGIDCVGLVVCIAKQFDLTIDLEGYYRRGVPFSTVKRYLLDHGFKEISHAQLTVGDFITAATDHGKAGSVSIISGTGDSPLVAGITRIIHCESAVPPMCVVEVPVDVQQLKRDAFMLGRSLDEMVRKTMRVFRFPFVSPKLITPNGAQ